MEAKGTEAWRGQRPFVITFLCPCPRWRSQLTACPWKPSPKPDMKCMWQICVLWVFWVLILCLTVPCLDQKPDSAPREKVMHLAPRHGNCLWFKFRKHGCPPETLNDSLCHRPVRGQSWFDACYERTMGYLVGTTAFMAPDSVLWWLVSG